MGIYNIEFISVYAEFLFSKGDDLVYGEAGKDQIYTGAGEDTIFSRLGSDLIYSERGKDKIFGIVKCRRNIE